jgi:hypothetical protein
MAAATDDSKTASSIMDPAVDDSRTASVVDPDVDVEKKELNDPPADGSKTASFTDLDVDIEKKELNAGNQPMTAGQSGEFKRGISNTQWILCCVGLYLAAFLYGE